MKRNINPLILINLLALLFLSACGGDTITDRVPLEKKFWTPEDYDKAIWEIEFNSPKEEQFPTFKDPAKSAVIIKLTDHNNYLVVLADPQIGLNHKSETAQAFFDQYQSLVKLYDVTDRQDKLVYDEELVAVEKFGLGLQILYFKSGNDNIVAQADNPEASDVVSVLRSNEQVAIGNYNLYLDEINREGSFSSKAIDSYCDGIDTYFPRLMETFPKANYNGMKSKAELMLNKAKSERIKKSLTALIEKISTPVPVQ